MERQCEYYPAEPDVKCENKATAIYVWDRVEEKDDDTLGGMRLALLMCDECADCHHDPGSWDIRVGL